MSDDTSRLIIFALSNAAFVGYKFYATRNLPGDERYGQRFVAVALAGTFVGLALALFVGNRVI